MVKVFLLDDDEDLNELNLLLLKSVGITKISSRTSGRDALHFLENCSSNKFPDIIFIDLNMPGMNGFEFIELFEEIFKDITYRPRIIMLTSSIDPGDKEKALSYKSVIGFYNKPISRQSLKQIIQELTIKKMKH